MSNVHLILGEHPGKLTVRLVREDGMELVATRVDESGQPVDWPAAPSLEFAPASRRTRIIATHEATIDGPVASWGLSVAEVEEIALGSLSALSRGTSTLVRLLLPDANDDPRVRFAGRVEWRDSWSSGSRTQRVSFTVRDGGGSGGGGPAASPTTVIKISGATQQISLNSDAILTGSLSEDAVITLAFSKPGLTALAFINTNSHTLMWGGQPVSEQGMTALSCAYDGEEAYYLVSGAEVSSIVPPIPDLDPPTDPANLAVSGIGATKITLTWDKSTSGIGVDHYNLSLDGGVTTIHEYGHFYTPGETTFSYEFVGLTPDTNYEPAVQAVDAAGQKSSWVSTTASTVPGPAHVPPSAPTGLSVVAKTSTSVTLDWDPASPGTVGYPVVGYRVSSDNGATWITQSVDDAVTTYVVTGLTEGQSYTFVVQAGDDVGWGPSSQAVVDSPAAGFADESLFAWNFDEGEGGSAAATAGGYPMVNTLGYGYVHRQAKHGFGLGHMASTGAMSPAVDTSLWDGLTVMLWAQMKHPAEGGKSGCLVVGSSVALASNNGVRLPAVPIFRLDRAHSGGTSDEYNRIIGRLTLDASSAHPYALSHNLTADVGLRGFNGTQYPLDHVAMTWDKATGAFKVYLNGVEEGSMVANGVLRNHRSTWPATMEIISTADLSEGVIAAPDFDAAIRDDLRIIPRALSAAEIATYMSEPVS